jgi:hypothetical protein
MAEHQENQNEEKEESLIDKIRKLITDDPSDKKSPGTGGRARQRRIDALVDEAVKGADEDNGAK